MLYTFSVKQLQRDFDAIASGDIDAVINRRDMIALINSKQNAANGFINITDADITKAIDAVQALVNNGCGWSKADAADRVAADIANGWSIAWCF